MSEKFIPKAEVEDSPNGLEIANQNEQSFLIKHHEKLRWLHEKTMSQDTQTKVVKWLFFHNAMNRFDFNKDTFATLATNNDKAHDELLGIKWRGFFEGGDVSEGTKRFVDFFEHVGDSLQTEFLADDEDFTNEEFVSFFELQIEIAKAKIGELKKIPNKRVANEEIQKLNEYICAFKEVVTKANNANILAKLDNLKTEIVA